MNLMNSESIKRKFILLIIFSILAGQLVECGKKKTGRRVVELNERKDKKDLLAPKEIMPSSSSPIFADSEEELFESASSGDTSYESAKNLSDEENENENSDEGLIEELGNELTTAEEEYRELSQVTKEEEEPQSAGELPLTMPSTSSERQQQAGKQPKNVGEHSEFELDEEELIIVALDFYKNPPAEVRIKRKRTDALGLLRRCIFKKLMFRNFYGIKMPKEQIKKLQERIHKVLDEIRAGKYEEYEQKSFDFVDENKLRELFKFVHTTCKSKNLVQKQKQIFGLYLAMNNLSIESRVRQKRKFEYKLTTAQRYHLNGFIQRLFYENFETKNDDLLFRRTRWHNSVRLSDFRVNKGPVKETGLEINKTELNSLFNDIVAYSTNRLRKILHKFSALFEITFGLYLKELGLSARKMKKRDIDAVNSAILEIMFKDIDRKKIEKTMRKVIATGYLANPHFYDMVREGNLERPIQYFFGKYLQHENLDRRKMDRKQLWYLNSVVYEILYERVDPELNLEFGSQILKEAQNHINEAMNYADQTEPRGWWWWNTVPAVQAVVAPAVFYAVDPMATTMTFYQYDDYSAPTYQQNLMPTNPQASPHRPSSSTSSASILNPAAKPFYLEHSPDAVPQTSIVEKSLDVGLKEGNISLPVPKKSYAQVLIDSNQKMDSNAIQQSESSEKGKEILALIRPESLKEQKPAKIIWADEVEEEEKMEKDKRKIDVEPKSPPAVHQTIQQKKMPRGLEKRKSASAPTSPHSHAAGPFKFEYRKEEEKPMNIFIPPRTNEKGLLSAKSPTV